MGMATERRQAAAAAGIEGAAAAALTMMACHSSGSALGVCGERVDAPAARLSVDGKAHSNPQAEAGAAAAAAAGPSLCRCPPPLAEALLAASGHRPARRRGEAKRAVGVPNTAFLARKALGIALPSASHYLQL